MSRPQHTADPSFLHLLLGVCGSHVAVSLQFRHCPAVLFRYMFVSHLEHAEAFSVRVKDPSWHCVHAVELMSPGNLNESGRQGYMKGSHAIISTPSAPEPDLLFPGPADPPPDPVFGNPSPPGTDPPITISFVSFHADPPVPAVHVNSRHPPLQFL